MTMTILRHTLAESIRPESLRHAERLAQKRKHELGGKPDPDRERHADWIDKHGRFTIPRTKGERK